MKTAVLACNGVDKPEGSLAREIGLLLAERSRADLICPVLLNRSPSRYQKVLGEAALVVVDGCGTRCASKLAAQLGVRPHQKVVVSQLLKAEEEHLAASLRLGPEEAALAVRMADDVLGTSDVAPAVPPAPVATATPATSATPAPATSWAPPADFFIVVHDKFEFRVPKREYWFTENDTWVRVVGDRARVGISDFLQQQLTDIVYYQPPELGAQVEQFGEVGEAESSKAIFEVVAPVSGSVVAVNEAVAQESPDLINADPYGEGWLVELELSAWAEERELLLDGAAYADILGPKASAS